MRSLIRVDVSKRRNKMDLDIGKCTIFILYAEMWQSLSFLYSAAWTQCKIPNEESRQAVDLGSERWTAQAEKQISEMKILRKRI